MSARKLRLSFAKGHTASGKETFMSRTIAKINPDLTNDKCKEFALAVKALYLQELKKATRIDETDIAL